MDLYPQGREFRIESVDRCPVCESAGRRELFVGYDDRYGHPDPYPVVECLRCQLAYLAFRPSEHDVPNLHNRYYLRGF